MEPRTEWGAFGDDLWTRLTVPQQSPTFVQHYVFFVVILGSVGTWGPLYNATFGRQSSTTEATVAVVSSLVTFLIAITPPALYQAVVAEESTRPFKMFAFGTTFTVSSIGVVAYLLNSLGLAIVGTVSSLLLWWLFNARNHALREPPAPPENAAGGDPLAPMPGSIDGWKV